MPGERSALYTVGFAAIVCAVCSILVSTAAVMLAPLREANELIDKRRNVLIAGGLIQPQSSPSDSQIESLYAKKVRPLLIDRIAGTALGDAESKDYDYRAEQSDPSTSVLASANKAGVARLPNRLMIYQIIDNNKVTRIVIPIQGKGLWSTLYGFLALDGEDPRVVRSIAFYEHGETPGLGGEVDNPKWQAKWNGRRALNDALEPAIGLVKGGAGSIGEDPHGVDALSGATMTSNGVTAMVRFWLGDDCLGPYLKRKIKGGES